MEPELALREAYTQCMKPDIVPVTRRKPAVVCRQVIVLKASGFRAAIDKY